MSFNVSHEMPQKNFFPNLEKERIAKVITTVHPEVGEERRGERTEEDGEVGDVK